MDYDINDLRLHTVDELDDQQKAYIKDHQDQLTDEDKEAYVSFLEESSQETPDPQKTEVDNDPHSSEPEPKTTPEPQYQADFDKRLEAIQKSIESIAPPVSPPQTEDAPKPPTFFGDNQPGNWQDVDKAIAQAYQQAKEDAIKAVEENNAKKIQEAEQKQEAIKKAVEGFEQEYIDLAKEGKIPDLNTEDGKRVKDQIWTIGNKYGSNNIHEAFNTWSQIAAEHGGGYNPQPHKTPEQLQKERLDAQKRAASQVGGGGGAPPSSKPTDVTYQDLAAKSLDQLIDEELSQ